MWVSENARAVLDETGTLLYYEGQIEDITERKQAEQALAQSHDLLNLTGQIARVGGWELDVETQTLTWTEEVYRIHEVDPATRLNVAEAINFYAPEARPVISAAVQAAINSGTAWDLELPLITAQGRRIWVRAQGQAERRDGRTVRVFGAFQDITERKQAEERLAQDHTLLRTLIDNYPIIFISRTRRDARSFPTLQIGRRRAGRPWKMCSEIGL